MAKFDLKFIDCLDSESNIQVIAEENMIIVQGTDNSGFDLEDEKDSVKILFSIFLDKSTAIKFAKTLRTEINKITESEVNNEK